jgi:hypothetical protein
MRVDELTIPDRVLLVVLLKEEVRKQNELIGTATTSTQMETAVSSKTAARALMDKLLLT